MTLSFPNPSRSYDSRQRRIRFWGHDAALEIPFFLDTAALVQLSPTGAIDEAGLLETFDLHRGAIQTAAARIYVRHGQSTYILMASHFA